MLALFIFRLDEIFEVVLPTLWIICEPTPMIAAELPKAPEFVFGAGLVLVCDG